MTDDCSECDVYDVDPRTINSGWSVAYFQINLALEALGHAEKLCRNVDEQNDLDATEAGTLLIKATQIEAEHTNEFRLLLVAVALFQAGMEALAAYAYSKPGFPRPPTSFVTRWRTALSHVQSPVTFDDYAGFYKKYRNAIIHPDSKDKYECLRRLEYGPVLKGITAGWEAFEALSEGYGEPHTEDDSWGTMCRLYGITPDGIGVPSLISLADRFWAKHQEFVDTVNAK